jgi:hypothetical protein
MGKIMTQNLVTHNTDYFQLSINLPLELKFFFEVTYALTASCQKKVRKISSERSKRKEPRGVASSFLMQPRVRCMVGLAHCRSIHPSRGVNGSDGIVLCSCLCQI